MRYDEHAMEVLRRATMGQLEKANQIAVDHSHQDEDWTILRDKILEAIVEAHDEGLHKRKSDAGKQQPEVGTS